MLLNYIRSRDKIYSAVPVAASLPWLLWLHYELCFFSLFISFVFLYYCSFYHSIFIFYLHPAQILTDGKEWAVNCWCLRNSEWLLIKGFKVFLWWHLRNMIMSKTINISAHFVFFYFVHQICSYDILTFDSKMNYFLG